MIVLSMLVLISALVLSFFTSVSSDLTSAQMYSNGENAKQLADTAVNVVMSQIKDATAGFGLDASGTADYTNRLAWASQPGMVRTWDSTGVPYKAFKLYSSNQMTVSLLKPQDDQNDLGSVAGVGLPWNNCPAIYTDLNSPVIGGSGIPIAPIMDPNNLVNTSGTMLITGTTYVQSVPGPTMLTYNLSGSANSDIEGFLIKTPSTYSAGSPISAYNNPVPMPVRWLYVLKDGQITSPTASGTNKADFTSSNPKPTAQNPIVGRIAFWADDETCKVNINTASEGTFWDVPRANNLEEHSNMDTMGTVIAPWGLGSSVPLSNEYQRTPGHPATTCLSTVLSAAQFTKFPTAQPIPVYPEYIQNNITGNPIGNTPDSALQPYYTLSPRVADGFTKGGTVDSSHAVAPVGGTNRLYNSVDELAFDPSRSVQISGSIVPITKFFLTAHSRAPEVNLFNLPRISMWPLQTGTATERNSSTDALLAYCSTIGGKEYYFQRYKSSYAGTAAGVPTTPCNDAAPGSSQYTDQDITLVPRNQLLLSSSTTTGYLSSLASNSIPGFGGAFSSKYPQDYQQILTEIFDYIRSGVNTVNWSGQSNTCYAATPLPNVPPSGAALAGAYSSVPIQITYPETGATQGFGRNYTIREVGICFFAAGNASTGDWYDTTRFVLSGSSATLGLFPTVDGSTSIVTSGTIFTLPTKWSGAPAATGSNGFPITSTISIDQVQVDGTGVGRKFLWGTPITDGSGHILPPIIGGHATAGPNSVPDDVEDDDHHWMGVGKPRTKNIQAFVFITPFNVNPGQPAVNPSLRYQIGGLDKFMISYNGASSTYMGFPDIDHAVLVARNGTLSAFPSGEAGFFNQFFGRTTGSGNGSTAISSMTDPACLIFPLFSGSIPLTGTAPIARFFMDGNANQFDSVCPYSVIDRTGTAPAVSGTHTYTNGSAKSGPSVFHFTGGDITIKIYTGKETDVFHSQLIQTLTVNFPSADLPLPVVARANPPVLTSGSYVGGDSNFALPTTNNGPNANPMSGGNPYKDSAFYTGFNLVSGVPNAKPSDSRYLNQRMTGTYPVTGSTSILSSTTTFPLPEGYISASATTPFINPGVPTSANQGAVIQNTGIGYAGNATATTKYAGMFRRGDVIRSVGIDPNGPFGSGGDIRLVAGLKTVPSTYFTPLAGYFDSTRYQIHSIYIDTGNFRTGLAFADITGTNPYLWNYADAGQGNGGHYYISKPRGSLLDGTSNGYNATVTLALKDQAGAFLVKSGASYPGDWDNGVGNNGDGPTLNKADEGYSDAAAGGGYTGVYFGSNTVGFTTLAQTAFSPNRQIASPVMFGSLPTGVISRSPWQTLLFCPNPASEYQNHFVGAAANHPGFGTTVSGDSGPSARPPFATPPDHLMLDWFWMPIVQPYAISDPMSTAGKVNMNFQILPFTYIERSTGVRAVLKNVKVQAIPSRAALEGSSYKTVFNASVDSTTPSFRYNINRDETIYGGFDARFSGTNADIFHSASEICNVFMVPKEQTGVQAPPASSTYGAMIAPPAPTGGYAGTAAWWDNYRLTGDNSRESPYNQIYPRLTTKSNTFQVHYRVQLLKKLANSDQAKWTEGTDQVVSEYRGSSILERYIDPNDTRLKGVDFTQVDIDAAHPDLYNIDKYYKFRVISTKVFTP